MSMGLLCHWLLLRTSVLWLVLGEMGIVHRRIRGIAIAATLMRLVGTARPTAARVESHCIVHLDLMQNGAAIHSVHIRGHSAMPLEVAIVIGILLLAAHHLGVLLHLLLLVLLVLVLLVLLVLLHLLLLMLWLLVWWMLLCPMIGHECPSSSPIVHVVHTPLLILGLCSSSSSSPSIRRVAH